MKHFKKAYSSRGFTLLEVAVVLAVIAVLAAILTPIITSYVDKARQSKAQSDLKSIAAAVTQFNTDMRFWPIYHGNFGTTGHTDANSTTDTYDFLYTNDGQEATFKSNSGVPNANDWTTTLAANASSNSFETVMGMEFYTTGVGAVNGRAWKGPYMQFGADPWGTKYYLTAKHLQPGSPYAAYVISAGPNQKFDTTLQQTRSTAAFAVTSDDLAVQIR